MSVITIQQSDIEAVWGTVFVAQWSNVGGVQQSPAANQARINAAIARGYAQVNGYLNNSPYQVPLNATDDTFIPVEIVDAMATIAGVWLFKSSGMNYEKDTFKWIESNIKRVNDLLQQIRIGNYQVACAFNTGRRQTPQVCR